jgi:hypothetical protein
VLFFLTAMSRAIFTRLCWKMPCPHQVRASSSRPCAVPSRFGVYRWQAWVDGHTEGEWSVQVSCAFAECKLRPAKPDRDNLVACLLASPSATTVLIKTLGDLMDSSRWSPVGGEYRDVYRHDFPAALEKSSRSGLGEATSQQPTVRRSGPCR